MNNKKNKQVKNDEVELTFLEKQQIVRTINPIRQTEQGSEVLQSDLSKLKGKDGVSIYFLKNDLNKAFEPIDDKIEQLNKEGQEHVSDRQQYISQKNSIKEDLKKHKDSKKLKEEIDSLDKKMKESEEKIGEINNQLHELSKHTEVVKLRKGKLEPSILDHMNSDEMAILEKVINFEGDTE